MGGRASRSEFAESHAAPATAPVIRTAVIPAGGNGTRMLPATKAIPKELLPITEKPALQFVVDEAIGAGVRHLVIVTSPTKPAIAEYFAASPETESILEGLGRRDVAEDMRRLHRDVRVTIVVQDEALGLGHAVGRARDAVGDEPFFVLLPDELMESSDLLLDMARTFERTKSSVVAVKHMPREDIGRYGVVAPCAGEVVSAEQDVIAFAEVVEKPNPAEAPSDLAIIGRYLLTPDIFADLAELEPGSSGELQLTDALARQAQRTTSYALVSEVGRRDIGHPLGWVEAVIEHAVVHPRHGNDIRRWIVEHFT